MIPSSPVLRHRTPTHRIPTHRARAAAVVLAVLAALLPALALSAAPPASADVAASGNRILPTTWESRTITSISGRGLDAARNAFDTGTTGPGVCRRTGNRTLHAQSNRSFCPGGANGNYAFRIDIPIVSAAGATWRMRIAPDNGYGGGLLVDGVDVSSVAQDMYDPGFGGTPNVSYFDITRTFTAGPHTLTLFGAEGCCDGASGAQVIMPGTTGWTLLGATPDVTVVGVSDGDSRSYAAPAPTCRATPFGGTPVTFAAVVAPSDRLTGPTTATCTYNDPTGGTGTAVASYTRTDTVAPVLSGTGVQVFEADRPSGAAAPYRQPTAVDAVDGARPVTCTPAPGTVFAFESNAVRCTATDDAGNQGVAGLKIVVQDTVAPVVTGAATTAPNTAGWYRDDVTFAWTATDSGSGIAPERQPADTVLRTEGRGQRSTVSVTDRRGNTGTGLSPAVDVDRTPPASTVTAPSGWVRSAAVEVTATDNLSGVASTHLLVDGVPQEGTRVVLDRSGTYALSVSSTDVAGNVEPPRTVVVTVDADAPVITARPQREPDGSGWYRSAVRVTFDCSDGADGSSSGLASCTPPVDVVDDGASVVTGEAADAVGNRSSAALTVQLDSSAPTVEGTLPEPNGAGWHRTDVVAATECADRVPGSGVTECTSSALRTDTADGSIVLTARDTAGNSTSRTVTGLKRDTGAPTVRLAQDVQPNDAGWIGAPVTVTPTCTDSLSGVATCTEPVTLGEGRDQVVDAEAVDVAGNRASTRSESLHVDLTEPVLAATVSGPQTRGTYTGPVTVSFTCSDALSGVPACPADVVLDTEGSAAALARTVTDRAGNTASVLVSGIVLDLTDPTLSAVPARAANPAGWYREAVEVVFVCEDEGSGVEICPPAEKITADGSTPVTVTAVDRAGRSTTRTFGPYRLDTVDPTLVGAPTTVPDDEGWYRDDVVVGWTATDALSGVPEQPAPSTIGGEGRALTATTSVSDRAGNTTTATSSEVRIDRTAPVTTVDAPSGWRNGAVTLTLTPRDELSGVAGTTYRVDGGTPASGTSVVLSEEGTHTVTFASTDVAGNAEEPVTARVLIDRTAPVISGLRSPLANGAGWNREPVSVTFTCTDEGGSAVASCTGERTVDTDTPGETVAGTATDGAGNTAGTEVLVKLDQVRPTVTATAPGANEDGWNDEPLTVAISCADAGSGVAACTPSTAVSEDTDGTVVTGTATDVAGNSSTAASRRIRLDTTAPSIVGAATTAPTSTGWYRGDVTVRFVCTDALSGVKTCTDDVLLSRDDDAASAVGTAVDRAGGRSTVQVPGLKIDATPPTLTATLSGQRGAGGYYTGDVTVTWSCSDATSGVSACPAPAVVTADGRGQTRSATISDRAGNTTTATSPAFDLDRTVPTISATVTPDANAAGWNASTVTVSFTCADTGSGVATCPADRSVGSGAGQLVTGTVVDRAGLSASVVTRAVSVDLVQPVVTYTGQERYTVDQTVQVACTASDALSGVVDTTCAPLAGPAYTLADRVLSAGATDRAGNTGTAQFTVRVTATHDTLCRLTQRLAAGQLGNSLCAKLSAARAATERGSTGAAAHQLEAYRSELAAQSGKAFTPEDAALLRAWATRLS